MNDQSLYTEYVRGGIFVTLKIRMNTSPEDVQRKVTRSLGRWVQRTCRQYVNASKDQIVFGGGDIAIGIKNDSYVFRSRSGRMVFVRDLVVAVPYFTNVQDRHIQFLGSQLAGPIGASVYAPNAPIIGGG